MHSFLFWHSIFQICNLTSCNVFTMAQFHCPLQIQTFKSVICQRGRVRHFYIQIKIHFFFTFWQCCSFIYRRRGLKHIQTVLLCNAQHWHEPFRYYVTCIKSAFDSCNIFLFFTFFIYIFSHSLSQFRLRQGRAVFRPFWTFHVLEIFLSYHICYLFKFKQSDVFSWNRIFFPDILFIVKYFPCPFYQFKVAQIN